jgi:hypothetical protein
MERRADRLSELVLTDDAAVLETLAARFGLHLPVGTQFPLIETP